MKKFKKSLVEFTTLLVICSPLVAIADYMYWCYKWGLVSGKEVNRIMTIRGRISAPYLIDNIKLRRAAIFGIIITVLLIVLVY